MCAAGRRHHGPPHAPSRAGFLAARQPWTSASRPPAIRRTSTLAGRAPSSPARRLGGAPRGVGTAVRPQPRTVRHRPAPPPRRQAGRRPHVTQTRTRASHRPAHPPEAAGNHGPLGGGAMTTSTATAGMDQAAPDRPDPAAATRPRRPHLRPPRRCPWVRLHAASAIGIVEPRPMPSPMSDEGTHAGTATDGPCSKTGTAPARPGAAGVQPAFDLPGVLR